MCRTATLVLIFAVGFSSPVLGQSFKGLTVGMPASSLPETISGPGDVSRSGWHDGDWFTVSLEDSRVSHFTVTYEGPVGRVVLDKTRISRQITLAQALKLHSLAKGNVSPRLGHYRLLSGEPEGVFDMANGIEYETGGAESADTIVKYVGYWSKDLPRMMTAPVLDSAQSEELLGAAQRASVPVQTSDPAQAASAAETRRAQALSQLKSQRDVVTRKAAIVFEAASKLINSSDKSKTSPQTADTIAELRRAFQECNKEIDIFFETLNASQKNLAVEDLDLVIFMPPLMDRIRTVITQVEGLGISVRDPD